MAYPSSRQATLPSEHESVALARQRLAQQKTVVGDRHADYATGLNQLALLLIMHGDPEEAEPLLRQALDIRKVALGEKHTDYATNLSSLAGLLWARGDLEGAEPLLRQALDVRWDVLGVDHPKTVASMSSLEQLLQMKRDMAVHDPAPRDEAEHVNGAAVASDPETQSDSDSDSDSIELTATWPDEPVSRGVIAPPAESEPSHRPHFEPEPEPEPEPESEPESAPEFEHPAASGEPLDLPTLHERLDGLTLELSGLGEALVRAAEAMKGRGIPAPGHLEDDLRSGRSRFVAVREEVARTAESHGIPGGRVRALADRDALASLLSELAEIQEHSSVLAQTQRRALEVLDRVLVLKHTDQPEFPPLRECQARAGERREAIASARPRELPDDVGPLAEGTHPFAALLTLAAGDDQVSDSLWTELMDAVRDAFGKGLAVAVGRSRIVLPKDSPTGR